MKVDDALAGVRRLGIDTAPLIYFVERHPKFVDRAREILKRVDAGSLEAVSSVVTLTEVLTLPKRLGKPELADEYRDLLLRSRHFALIDIDARIAELASDLRARHGLRTPDALQVASAIAADCDAFLTNDTTLARVPSIRVLVLQDLEM